MLYSFLIILTTLSANLPETWVTNFDEAIITATDQNKNILMVFSGSDWCAPCKKLRKDILTTDEFEKYEKQNLVILYLDFPSKKKNKLSKEQTKHNESLADKYNRSGSFPKVMLLNSSGETVKEIKYEGQSTSDYIAAIR